jgi:short-subunit dehydrogenase
MKNIFKRIVILGASRGLGLALTRYFIQEIQTIELLLVSRKINQIKIESSKPKSFSTNPNQISKYSCDFSQIQQLDQLVETLTQFAPTHIYYIAGGGPYGEFQTKNWKDHIWTINVNLLFPGELLHRILKLQESFNELQQITFIGSNIAENAPDPKSSSYAMAKHGLKGLITSIQHEQPTIDLRLFSPGYIDTTLLPPNSEPRIFKKNISQAVDIAQVLYNWSANPLFKNQHFKFDN